MKTAVMTFGRMNPPTRGHFKLIKKMKEESGFVWVFLSSRQDNDRNPLSHEEKSHLLYSSRCMKGVGIGPSGCTNIFQALEYLDSLDYERVIIYAGSDRVGEFEGKFEKYNGKDFTFQEIIVKSAGDRSEDEYSATRAREAARKGDLDEYFDITSDISGFSLIRNIYGMNEYTPGSLVYWEHPSGISAKTHLSGWRINEHGEVYIVEGNNHSSLKLCDLDVFEMYYHMG